jgi:hypothetical protein
VGSSPTLATTFSDKLNKKNSMQDYKVDSRFSNSNELEQFMKNLLLEKMKEFNIVTVSAEFDGCGDDGQFDNPDAEGDGDVESFLKCPITTYNSVTRYSKDKQEFLVKEYDSNIKALILDSFYYILEHHHDGWEINDGAYGTVYFNVDGSGKIEYNQRIMDVEYSEDEF